ncbi:hypothetical protein Taro_056839 [Colocasia esculenta]|uniref:Uncharacterized protein n=1 Tax=Colocasia esculenta TaxID=4460 RepID=A0A843XXW4_COLES|nr:hypothetical protein [Colocasia esculenta]
MEDTCRQVQVRCSWSSPAFGCVRAAEAERACVLLGLHRCRVVVCGTGGRCLCPVGCPSVVGGVCCVGCVFGLGCLCAVVRCARDAELSRCLVCRVAPLGERATLACGLFLARFCCCRATSESENGALVVLVEVLPGPACVASAVLFATVFSLMVRVVGLCILVKVLPKIALCRFWWKFFPGVLCVCFGPPLSCPCGLRCSVWLGCILVRFSQNGSWRFWWRFSPKLLRVVVVVAAHSLSVEMSCRCLPVGLSVLQSAWALSCSRPCRWTLCIPGVQAVGFVFGAWRALAGGGLVSAVGARLAVLLVEALVLRYGLPLARGRDSLRCVSPSSVFRWLLEVVMLHCGFVSSRCASLRPSGGVIFP